jgi:hypothetical protein
MASHKFKLEGKQLIRSSMKELITRSEKAGSLKQK